MVFLLSVVMVLSLGATAFADQQAAPLAGEAVTVVTPEEFKAAMEAGGAVELAGNIVIDTEMDIHIATPVTLDLKGFTVTKTYGARNHYFMVIQTGGSLTLTDSASGGALIASDSSYGYGIQLEGSAPSFIMEGGRIETTQESIDISDFASDVKVEIYDGMILSSDDSVLCVRGSNTDIDITGGTLQSGGRTGVYISGSPDTPVQFDMTGGKLTQTSGRSGAIQAYKGAELTIGGSAEIEGQGTYAVQAQNTVKLEITDGLLSSTGSTAVSLSGTAECIISGGSVASITGAAIRAEDTAVVNVRNGSIASERGAAIRTEDNASVNIAGGTLKGAESTGALQEYGSDNNSTITVTGGTFSSNVDTYIPSGLTIQNNGDGTFTVKRMDIVFLDGGAGDDGNSGADAASAVKTLDEALTRVADGGTIVITGPVSVSNAGKVDLSGVTVKRDESYTGNLFNVTGTTVLNLSNVTIDGNSVEGTVGELIMLGSGVVLNIGDGAQLINNLASAVYMYDSTLNLNGGSIKNNTTEDDGGGIFADCGTVNLNSGEISGNSAAGVGGGICILCGTATLDGAEIKGNEAFRGGGVYVEGQDGGGAATFTVKSGSITGNALIEAYFEDEDYYWTADGAGICAWYGEEDTTVEIMGGTIEGNDAGDGVGAAISLNRSSGITSGYATLKLSGSPKIVGEVYLEDEEDGGPVIQVTDTFTPANAIVLCSNYGISGTTAVKYAQGLVPDLEHFALAEEMYQYNDSIGLRVNGQTIEYVDQYKVVFKSSVYGTTFETIYVMPDTAIDPAQVPAPTKTGYTLAGWRAYGQTAMWDMENDAVTDGMTLISVWTLNAPTVSVNVDKATVHTGEDIILTATPVHPVEGLLYTYDWYKDGIRLTGETADSLTVTESGSYTVEVTATDGALTSASVESDPVVCTVEGHVFGGDWESDDANHWHECVCGEKSGVAEHTSDGGKVTTAPTEITAGVKTYTCTECGRIMGIETIPPLGPSHTHVYGDEWKFDDVNHWHECVCGEKSGVAEHTSDGGKVTTAPTETTAGVKTYTCTECGKVLKTEVIPATGTNATPPDNTGEAPETGDESNLSLWIILLGVAAGAMVATITVKKRSGKRG